MSLKKKAKQMWQKPYGGLLVILIAYVPAPIIYLFLDASWEESALYTSVWSLMLTGVGWFLLEGFINYLAEEEEGDDVDARV